MKPIEHECQITPYLAASRFREDVVLIRIAYLLHWSGGKTTGVFKKVVEQVNCWISEGHESRIFVVCRQGTEKDWMFLQSNQGFEVTTRQFRSKLGFISAMLGISQDIRAWRPQVVYERDHDYVPGLSSSLHGIPRVVEVNSVLEAEAAIAQERRSYSVYVRFTHPFVLRAAAGHVFVTRELQRWYHGLERPSTVIANGIAIDSFRPTPPSTNFAPRLVFIGSPGQAWHGVDKIECLASRYRSWHFDLIGIDREQLPIGERLPNVVCHGMLERHEYEKIISSADVAIGTLAAHRIGLEELCPLKTREYLARGLPVIIGYRDTDFGDGTPFILRLPNVEENISRNLQLIEKFVMQWKGRRVSSEAIRVIDVRFKELQRLKFLNMLIHKPGI